MMVSLETILAADGRGLKAARRTAGRLRRRQTRTSRPDHDNVGQGPPDRVGAELDTAQAGRITNRLYRTGTHRLNRGQ